MKTIDYKGTEYKCPFSETFRRHTKAERDTLRDSVAKNGIKNAVIVYEDEEHGDDCILDGEGRLTAVIGNATANVPFKHAGKMTTAQAYELAKVYNDHRRQDTPEAIAKRKLERVERVAEARAEGKSLRVIAEDEGVDEKTIRKDLKTGADQSAPEPEKVTGKDGKKQSAKKKKKEPTASPEPVKQSDDEPDDKPTKVQVSPEPEPISAIKVIEGVCRAIDQLNRQLDEIKKEPLAYPVHFHSVQSALKNAREILWSSRAVHPDPYCKGKGEKNGEPCKPCRGTGMVIKSVNTQAVRAVGPVEDAAA